jgi:acetyltransferase-like isoleucine patch superfamily enzyme
MNFIAKTLSIPRSIYVNLRTLPFKQAIKCPIYIGNNVRFDASLHKGMFRIKSDKIYRGMVAIGWGEGSYHYGDSRPSHLRITKGAQLVFKGSCLIKRGVHIDCLRGGILEFGNKVSFNANCTLSSNTRVVFEDNVLAGWNVTVIDWDGHQLFDKESNDYLNPPQPIIIGKGCWLCADATIMGGVSLINDVIVPFRSLVTKSCDKPYTIFGGLPNRIIKENIYRKY